MHTTDKYEVAAARELTVLAALNSRPTTVGYVAGLVGLKPDTVTAALKRLENRGLARANNDKQWTRWESPSPRCDLCLRPFESAQRGLEFSTPAKAMPNGLEQRQLDQGKAAERERQVIKVLDRIGTWATFERIKVELQACNSEIKGRSLNATLQRLQRSGEAAHRIEPREEWRSR